MNSSQTITLLKGSNHEITGLEIGGVQYKNGDIRDGSICIPEAIINEIDLAAVPEGVDFEVELVTSNLRDSTVPTCNAIISPDGSNPAMMTFTWLFERGESNFSVSAEVLAKAAARYLIAVKCGTHVQVDYNECDDDIHLSRICLIQATTFGEALATTKAVVRRLGHELERLEQSIWASAN